MHAHCSRLKINRKTNNTIIYNILYYTTTVFNNTNIKYILKDSQFFFWKL